MKIAGVISRLAHGGVARQLSLLAVHWPRDRHELHVISLGPDAGWSAALRRAGVSVDALDWRLPFDARPLLALRRHLHDLRPDVVHAWDLASLRAVAALAPGRTPLVLSGPRRGERVDTPGPLDRALIRRRVRRVLVHGAAEAERYRQGGLPDDRLTIVPPGVALPSPGGPPPQLAALPADARVILGVGPFLAGKGYRDAVWALDILGFVENELHLVLVGAGPETRRLHDFARVTRAEDRVHFLGAREDVAGWMRRADVVWVPSRADCGVNVALEAMAAGRPLVASRTPTLAEVVGDGGVLIARGDPAGLARATRALLEDPARATAMAEAAARRAAADFSVDALVRNTQQVYAAAGR